MTTHNYLMYCTFLLVLSTLLGCEQSDSSFGFGGSAQAQSEADLAADSQLDQTETVLPRQLIQRGYVAFETDDVEGTRTSVRTAVERFGGYVVNDEGSVSERRTSGTLEIRVPAGRFDSLLQIITEGVAHIDRQSITLEDVTEEFLDVSARLTTKRALETRYLELLERATTVADLLAIEQQIGELRTEIEQVEGRLNYLKNQVALATLTVQFYETHQAGSAFGTRLVDGLSDGWQLLLNFFVLLVNVWPFVLIALLFLWWWRRRRSRRAA